MRRQPAADLGEIRIGRPVRHSRRLFPDLRLRLLANRDLVGHRDELDGEDGAGHRWHASHDHSRETRPCRRDNEPRLVLRRLSHPRRYVLGVAAAGRSSGRPRRRRAYAAVNSAPYSRITACTYTQTRKTTTAAIDPLTRVKRVMSRMYQENASKAPFQS